MNKRRILSMTGTVLLFAITLMMLLGCKQNIAVIDNTAFIEAVGGQCGWTVEKDRTVRLTKENLSSIRAVTQLNISKRSLSDLSGIEYFSGLEYLDCAVNSLTTLDVSGCKALKVLDCSDNDLISLNVSSNTDLTSLKCPWNKMLTIYQWMRRIR